MCGLAQAQPKSDHIWTNSGAHTEKKKFCQLIHIPELMLPAGDVQLAYHQHHKGPFLVCFPWEKGIGASVQDPAGSSFSHRGDQDYYGPPTAVPHLWSELWGSQSTRAPSSTLKHYVATCQLFYLFIYFCNSTSQTVLPWKRWCTLSSGSSLVFLCSYVSVLVFLNDFVLLVYFNLFLVCVTSSPLAGDQYFKGYICAWEMTSKEILIDGIS